ncbi:MAG: hypothetical protein A2075_09085 [Geobacteraceae bacterium GWC2_58_44]|nr:MAG: hypothetical protein A2075_09085 [Geobacteraceae bacterium GWC2_58_44]HBG07667.1 hypothetical protein [Geobacter sp.]
MNADRITTIIGSIGAAATAVQPVLTAIQPGAVLHLQDYLQLLTAGVFAILGFFSNRKTAQG